MAINFLTTTNTLPGIQINDAGNNPRLELQESGSVSGGISTTGGALVFEASSGIEKARILSTGQFLIGHTSYYYAGTYLQVGNTSDSSNGLQITTSTTGNGYILFGDGTGADAYTGQIRYSHTDNFMRFDTNSTVAMTIDSSQEVGIGTLTPAAKLHVKSGDENTLRLETTSGEPDIRWLPGGSHAWQNRASSSTWQLYQYSQSEWVFNLYNGKLGIGLTQPSGKLQVNGDVKIGNATTGAQLQRNGDDFEIKGVDTDSNAWNSLHLKADSLTGLYIEKDTNDVGIKTSSPAYDLDIAGDQMRLGDSNQTTTYFRMEATNTAGAPARAVGILQKGYESRAQGIFHEDTGKSGEEWFSGIPYGATFNNWQVGFDGSGSGQPEYTANAILTAYHDKSVYLNAYGSGTYTGTAAKLLAITSSGKIIETSSGSDLPGGPYLPLTAGSGNKLTGDLYIEEANTPSLILTDTTNSLQGRVRVANTAMYIDADSGEGVASTTLNLQVDAATKLQLTESNSRFLDQNLSIRRDDTTPVFNFERNDSSIVAGNDLGQLLFRGADPSGWNEGARISVEADGTWDTDVYPTRFKFDVKATDTLQTALKLEKDMDAVFGKDILLGDNQYAYFGTGNDLQIYHNGSDSYIRDSGTGVLAILSNETRIQNSAGNENCAKFTENGSVALYYDNTQKFETTSTGITASGSRSIFAADTVVNSFSGVAGVEVYKNAGDSVLMVHQDDGNHESKLHFRTGGNDTQIIVPPNTNALKITTETTSDALVLSMSGYLTLQDGIQATNSLFNGTMNISAGIYHIGDTDTFFGFVGGNDTFGLTTGGGSRMDANNAGVRFGGGGTRITTILDEDNMASDSNTALATQQSIKAYVDTSITGSTSFRGAWDPDAGLNGGYGNPNLNTVTKQDGYYYICSDNGSATPNGTGTTPNSWHTGDWVVYNSNLGSSGEWQKIDNSSVISGAGTGGKVVKWSGSGTSETLTDSIIQDNGSGVGIGTAPASGVELHVDGDVRVDSTSGIATRKIRSGYFSSSTDIVVASGSSANVRLQNGTTDALVIDSSQNSTFSGTIGIGVTANSTYDLNIFRDGNASARVSGNGNATLILNSDSDNSGTAGSYLTYRDNGTSKWILYKETNNDFYLYNVAAGKFPIHAQAGGNILLMEDGNNLGIGVGTPAAKLDVNAGTENFVANFTSTDSIAEIRIEDSSNYTRLLTVGTQFKIMPNDGSETLILDGNDDSATFAGDVTIGALTSGETAQLTVNNEGGVPSVARFKSRTNKAHIEISDNDTTGYVSSENNFFSIGRNAGVNANNINIDANNRVGIGTTTIQGNTKVNISGAMLQDGKTSWLDSSGTQLSTTGRVVAGLVGNSGGNGASALYIFTCYGGGGYQRIVYSIINVGGTWQCHKDIDEGQNAFDVVASTPTSGSAVTFTFKARSTAQSYTASVWIEHIGSSIDTQYVG